VNRLRELAQRQQDVTSASKNSSRPLQEAKDEVEREEIRAD